MVSLNSPPFCERTGGVGTSGEAGERTSEGGNIGEAGEARHE